jgi:potassium channel subfamily K
LVSLPLTLSSRAEFIIFKLKEMGKIEQKDVNAISEEFDNRDVDGSRTLTLHDLVA